MIEENYLTPQMPASSASHDGPPPIGFWGTYRKSILTGLIAVAVLTAGLLIYVLFFRGAGSGEEFKEDVEIALTAPEGTPSGAEMTYDIEIVNRANTTLTNVSLELI